MVFGGRASEPDGIKLKVSISWDDENLRRGYFVQRRYLIGHSGYANSAGRGLLDRSFLSCGLVILTRLCAGPKPNLDSAKRICASPPVVAESRGSSGFNLVDKSEIRFGIVEISKEESQTAHCWPSAEPRQNHEPA